MPGEVATEGITLFRRAIPIGGAGAEEALGRVEGVGEERTVHGGVTQRVGGREVLLAASEGGVLIQIVEDDHVRTLSRLTPEDANEVGVRGVDLAQDAVGVLSVRGRPDGEA
ncbi:MAG: hypothetical protein ACYTFV_14480, partial [Planctomycetota bacterium]